MSTWSLALRFIRRDWRSGELRLLMLALMVAVAAVTAVGFFTDRVDRAIVIQANEILAADLVISGSSRIPDDLQHQATEFNLATSRLLTFPSIAMHGDATQLVAVKAVDSAYPLRGELRTRPALDTIEEAQAQPPASGTAWSEARLFSALSMQPGDHVSLGESKITVSAVLSRDSAAGRNIFRLGPEFLMRLEDIPETGLVTPASRVRHQLLVAGSEADVERYREWANNRLPRGFGIEHMSNARPELRGALDRGGNFLALAALVAVLVAGATVALSTRRFVELQSDTSAILRCLGAQQRQVLNILLIRLAALATTASLIGILLGFAAQAVLADMLSEWFGNALPPPSFWPVASGLAVGFITLAGFTLPSAVRLSAVPPLRVLRRDLGAPPAATWLLALFSIAAMALMMLWQAEDWKLALWVIGGSLACVLLLLLSSYLLVKVLSPLRQKGGSYWRYGLAGLTRNPALTAFQLTGFGLGILALLLLTFVRIDLLNAWQKTIPPEAPNQFLINIQPADVEQLQLFFAQQGLQPAGIYPMLRARLTHINEHEVSREDYQEERAQRLASREFNLSFSNRLQSDNRIVSGRWWGDKATAADQFSVELGISNTLGIKLNDQLVFNLAGTPIQGKVTSLRTVRWDSFQPNFFVIGTPEMLQQHPTTFITSFYLPAGQEHKLVELTRAFPSVTSIDVSAIMNQIREIMSQGSKAVEYVFLFTLAAGLLMFYAGIQATRELRRQESAILRTLGIQRNTLLAASSVEFVTLGLLAGLLASAAASITGWVLATEIFEFSYQFNFRVWISGVFLSGIGIGLAGVIAAYPLTIRPPLQTLQGR